MKYQAIRKLVALWAILLLAVSALPQANPNIVIPQSSVRKYSGILRRAFTNYTVYVGPWGRKSIDDWQAEIDPRGPAFQQTISGYHPADIQAAYKIPASGGSQAIAIIDAFHLPTALNDFNVFSSAFGLPQETSANATSSSNKVLQVIYASGSKPATNADWGGEIALDIEWAHAAAPNAKIYLIECASDSLADLMVGVRYAATQLADVRQISMSFGTLEFSQEQQFDSNFTGDNKVFFASAGDTSNDVNYPAVSTQVIGVGGTALYMSNGNVTAETAWSSGAGGVSVVVGRPSFQDRYSAIIGTRRGTPDIAAVGDPQTGCAVYDSTPIQNVGSGWLIFGGTSLSAPVCAGITNCRGEFSATTTDELVRQYSSAGGSLLRDITTGKSGNHAAAIGYDLVTGVGVPIGTFSSTGTATSFAPTGITLVSGVRMQGIPVNIIAKDAHDYLVRSITSGGQKAVIGGTFQLKVSATAVLSANVSVTGLLTSGACQLSFYNKSTSNWDSISDLSFASTNKTVNVTLGTLTDYIDAGGNLKFRIAGSSTGVPFRLGIDQIVLNATVAQ